MSEFLIFAGESIHDAYQKAQQQLSKAVEAWKRHDIISADEASIVAYLVDQYRLHAPVIAEEQITAEHGQATQLVYQPGWSMVYSRTSPVTGSGVVIRIPFTGDAALLRLRPTRREGMLPVEVEAETKGDGGDIVLRILAGSSEGQVKAAFAQALDVIVRHARLMQEDVEGFNQSIAESAHRLVASRRATVLREDQLIASLGVTVRRADTVPETFALPVRPKRVTLRPLAAAGLFMAEPAMDAAVYEDMLRVLLETGTAIERAESYVGMGEEQLRDQFAMTLGTHYPDVAREAKNRAGKTDILLRHAGGVLFATECKFWDGAEHYRAALSQTLSYLTWRESRAALLLFISNKALQPVLDQIESATSTHPAFVAFRARPSEGRFDFDMRLLDDATRGVKLAVICFHFPS